MALNHYAGNHLNIFEGPWETSSSLPCLSLEDEGMTAGPLTTELQEIRMCTRVDNHSSGGDRMPTPKLLHGLRPKNRLLARGRQSLISGCCSQVRWWLWLFFLLSLKWGKMSTRDHARENRNRPANQSQARQPSSLAKQAQVCTCYQQRGSNHQTNTIWFRLGESIRAARFRETSADCEGQEAGPVSMSQGSSFHFIEWAGWRLVTQCKCTWILLKFIFKI